MKADQIVSELIAAGVKFDVVDNKLKVIAGKGIMTPDLLAFIKDNKEEIVRILNDRADGNILPAGEKEYYVTSPAQRRLYFASELTQTSLGYNLPQAIRIEGPLNKDRLTMVFNQLAVRHESLRTFFTLVDSEPVQKIAPSVEIAIEYFEADEQQVDRIVHAFVRSFDLGIAPLMRVGLIRTGKDQHVLIVDIHHIITDGVANVLLIQEFRVLYNGQELPPIRLQYRDYAEWQQDKNRQSRIGKQRDFWLDRLGDHGNAFAFPFDYVRPSVKSHKGETTSFRLDSEQTRKLKAISREEGVTLFMTVLAIYSILLSKVSGSEDVIVGSPVTGRSHPDMESIIGMFVNILPLRTYPRKDMSFREYLAEVRTTTLAAIDNQDYQYEELIDALRLDRDPGRYPLIDIMYVHHGFEEPVAGIPELLFSQHPIESKVSKFDLMLISAESNECLDLNFEFSTELFKKETILALAGWFNRIVLTILSDREKRIGDIRLITPAETEANLYTFNDTAVAYPLNKTVVSLFEEQVEKNAEAIALHLSFSRQTFAFLMSRVNGLICFLQQNYHIKKGDMIGVLMEREEWLVPVVLAVLKAGGIYVPLDPHHPAARIDGIIQDARCKVVVSRSMIDLDAIADLQGLLPDPVLLTGEDPAYMIYTSGSTGMPKGVLIKHGSLTNYLYWAADTYVRQEKVGFPLLTSISFDLTLTSLFLPLVTGNTLYVYEEDDRFFPIDRMLESNQVEVVKLTPSHLKLIRDSSYWKRPGYQSRIRRFIVGGEELTTQLAREIDVLFHGNIEIYNEYGPTEATIGCMIHRFDPCGDTGRTVPIGHPISNAHVYLLDKDLYPVPAGITGELYIGGVGTADGYWQRDELSRERFLFNPHLDGERIYRTGDLAKRLTDGGLEFLGRADGQVKIHGYRIEPGEIEQLLSSHPLIRECAVIVREKNGENRIAAFFQPAGEIDASALRTYLAAKLPDYMLPSSFTEVTAMPLTSNGKLDIRSLPEPETAATDEDTQPANETEQRLIEIWSEILRIDKSKIGSNSNFFALGGHSLRTYNLLHRVEAEFSIKIPLISFFEKPTIRELQKSIQIAHLSQRSSINISRKVII